MTKHRIPRPHHGAHRTAPADRMGPRLRHRRRGNALLRHGTRVAIIGGVALTAGFGIMAYRTTSAQDAARAAAKERVLADERHQYALQQAALARVRAQQEAASRAARFAALRTAQAQARAHQVAAASAAAASAVATSAPTSTPATASASSGTLSAASTPAAAATPSATPSTPVVSSGGS